MPAPPLHHIRLLLLDLDDTLFDCAGTLVPAAHRDAVAAMVAAGLPGPVAARSAELRGLLATTPEAAAAYADLAARHACPDAVAAAGRRAFFERDVPPIEPFPGVRAALDGWAGRLARVLVTLGDPATQQAKVARLALAPHLDAVRYVARTDTGGKSAAFADEMARRGIPPADTLVVGNRVDDEIAAGNRLGCVTALVAGGEFAARTPERREELPHLALSRFADLVPLLAPLPSRLL